MLSLAGVFLYLDPQIPTAESYRHVRLETPLRVYTADRQLIAEFGERRLIPLTLNQVPPLFVSALLDTEDKRFYQHNGIDYISLANDTLELALYREIRSGASTITMQLARNISFSLEQTFIRKFKEMLLALKIEQELSKDEILELYMNVVPFGKRAYGAQAGALTYYGKRLNQLNLPQLAMLAGIPQAPTAGNPVNGPQRALRRRNVVLGRMLDQNSITQTQYDEAIAAPISASIHDRDLDVPAPFPAEWVRAQLISRYPNLYTGGYQVITTIDGELQRTATSALRKGLTSYDRRHGYRGAEQELGAATEDYLDALTNLRTFGGMEPAVVTNLTDEAAEVMRANGQRVRIDMQAMKWAKPYIDVDTTGRTPSLPADVLNVGDVIRIQAEAPEEFETRDDSAVEIANGEPPVAETVWRLAQLPEIQGALVSLDPQSGAVLALEGGFDFGMNQYNHALQAARQPGSGFKPFVYSAALHHGVTPASLFMDAPLVFNDRNLESQYRPDNDNNRYNGPTRLRVALYRSINLVSMRVLLKIGAGRVMDYVRSFGFDTSTFPRNTQLAIGGGTMAVTPMDMVNAYAVFANGGWLVQPHVIDRVIDLEGQTIFEAQHPVVCDRCNETLVADLSAEPANIEDLFATDPSPPRSPVIPATRVVDERNVYIMNSMLRDVIRRGTGSRAWRALGRSDLAGKTGTTNNAADTWFNGFNPDVATTVWVGFPNHQPLGKREYGSNTPLPIWIDFMTKALAGKSETAPSQPAGVVTMKIDPESGELATAQQKDAIFELFLTEHTPQLAQEAALPDSEPGDLEFKPVDIF
ncbi:MAG: PBP1A family penicillin-binding protein [Gammaproteobacteria bacterium]|nr:PBP1A family penicillin-binding protein [Gammaproteobacteria bacterium]